MKPLILTGIAQETQLDNPDEAILLLVFNGGELRVPTNDVGLQAVLTYLGQISQQEEVPTYPNGADVFGGNGNSAQATSLSPPPTDASSETEEDEEDDDYDEINDGIGQV